MNNLEELTESEYLEISGGKHPNDNTSFFYDVGYLIGKGARKIKDIGDDDEWFG